MLRGTLLAASIAGLLLCTGRVGAWAAPAAGAEHACCAAGEDGKAPLPELSTCCPDYAAVSTPRPTAPTASALIGAAPRVPPDAPLSILFAAAFDPDIGSPPLAGPSSRGPPLA